MTALSTFRIVELAERVTGEYTGKLLADFGAEVIKVERPGGSPTRALGPFVTGKDGVDYGAPFTYLNTNKKSVVLDLDDAGDRAVLDRLLASAHALVDDHDEDWHAARGLVPDAVAERFPKLVHCVITPFGQGAPAEWQRARPINVMNQGGWGFHTPAEVDPAKPPLKGAGRFMSDYEAAIEAALCIGAALHRQNATGTGQFIDISEVEVQVSRADIMVARMLAGDVDPGPERTHYDMGGPGTSFACADGHVFLVMTSGAHWQGLVKLVGEAEWAKAFPPDWLEFGCTPERVTQFRENFIPWIAQQKKHEVAEAAQRLNVALVPINNAADLHDNAQVAWRGFFQEVEHPALGTVRYPTVSYKLSASPARITSPAPALGANDGEIDTLQHGGTSDAIA